MHALNAKDIQYDLGLLYFKEGKYQEALEIFEKIQKEKPDNLQVINMYERTREALNGS
jgi:tetratricopeptide (TPR) repeat protein